MNMSGGRGHLTEQCAGVKCFTEALQCSRAVRSALSVASAVAGAKGGPAMTKTLITTILALGLGLLSTPSFAGSYIVNGRTASPAEAQHLVASGVQPGAWVVNGYGIAPAAERASFTEPRGKKCYYVLDVLLCD
jgi:hypothetical protein